MELVSFFYKRCNFFIKFIETVFHMLIHYQSKRDLLAYIKVVLSEKCCQK
ncbi:hypothetical protein AI2839V1_2608 [Enterobacter cloacae]|jgi:hypothetical protein|nr:hypothetical protein SP99_02641 [Enterobacter sp. BIDMC92]CAF2456177.1 hypothetical protein AI2839V1_2608 [Enterobacter cloacae]CAH5310024.1 hypothetical protein AI2839V1_2608 [Enterobacter cloacae]SFJ11223.1 hypothetical protein SAMN03159336_0137 [Enterobacter sp. NFIX59]